MVVTGYFSDYWCVKNRYIVDRVIIAKDMNVIFGGWGWGGGGGGVCECFCYFYIFGSLSFM